jgi:hypothetical protein
MLTRVPVFQKEVLTKLFQQRPLARGDVNRLRAEIVELRRELYGRIKRLPRSARSSTGFEVPPTLTTYANNGALLKFARTSLSALYARTWTGLYLASRHPSIAKVWPDLRSE